MTLRVVVLGAAGFLGSRLAAQLAKAGRLGDRTIDELVLVDLRAARMPERAQCPVLRMQGDVRDPSLLDAVLHAPADVVFHLAATLTLDAETDFQRGLETNVLAFIALLERLRAQASAAPMLLFASSISTYGGRLPAVVGDDVFQAPTTSYGMHKVVAEHLLADYSRRGFVDGRALRLPIVLTHPGPASGSISDQVASLVREPLRGRSTVCRMAPESRLVVVSVDKVVESFLHLASLPAEALPGVRTMNLPGLTLTPAQLVAAVARRLPPAQGPGVQWTDDPQVQRIVDGWPGVFTSKRASALGFAPDVAADDVVDAFLRAESR